jgi:hypothetical protein
MYRGLRAKVNAYFMEMGAKGIPKMVDYGCAAGLL